MNRDRVERIRAGNRLLVQEYSLTPFRAPLTAALRREAGGVCFRDAPRLARFAAHAVLNAPERFSAQQRACAEDLAAVQAEADQWRAQAARLRHLLEEATDSHLQTQAAAVGLARALLDEADDDAQAFELLSARRIWDKHRRRCRKGLRPRKGRAANAALRDRIDREFTALFESFLLPAAPAGGDRRRSDRGLKAERWEADELLGTEETE